MQFVQIHLEVIHVLVNHNFQELASFVMVILQLFLLSNLVVFNNIFFSKIKKDIDECLNDNGGCDSNANCKNTFGGFNCTCQKGFEGNGFICSGMF